VRHWLAQRHPDMSNALREICIEKILLGAKDSRTSMTENELAAIVASVLQSHGAGSDVPQPEAAR
jgi:hypothetical protein